MDTNREQELLDRLAALEQRVEQAEKKAERADDYRQIMNVMAGHSFCYNAHEQQYEIDRFWTKEKEDCWYNGNTTPIGVETYYVNNTKRLRALQRDIVNRVYHKALTEKDKVGYRVMNMLTTPFIEIAGDGQTAKGLWNVRGSYCRLTGCGPIAYWTFGWAAVDFVLEAGQWKIWHMQLLYNVDAQCGTPLTEAPKKYEPIPEFAPMDDFRLPAPNKPAVLMQHYSTERPATKSPRAPERYETFADTFSYGA